MQFSQCIPKITHFPFPNAFQTDAIFSLLLWNDSQKFPELKSQCSVSLQDQAVQKKRCLESVLYVSEVENLFQVSLSLLFETVVFPSFLKKSTEVENEILCNKRNKTLPDLTNSQPISLKLKLCFGCTEVFCTMFTHP